MMSQSAASFKISSPGWCRMVTVLFFLLSSGCSFVTAQSYVSRLDSLARVARMDPVDTIRILACADLCYEYRFVNQDSALKYGRKGIALGKRVGFSTGLAQVFSDAAFIHYDRGDLDSAVFFWQSALALRTDLDDKAGIASLKLKLGAAHFRKGAYNEALRCQLDALRSYEELNLPQWIGQALNNVAAVYQHQKHLDKALEYYERAYVLHQKNGSKADMGSALINIGNVYFLRKDYDNAKQDYSRALLLLANDNQPTNTAVALNNLAEIYVLANQYDSAAFFADRALSLRRSSGDIAGVISSLNMMGRIHTKLKNVRLAHQYLDESLALAIEKNILYEQGRIYQNLYELYSDNADWKKSLEAHVKYTTIRDSLLNEAGRKEVAAMQVEYETAKKEQQIALQAAALSEKEVRIERDAIIIIGLAVTVVLAVVIFALLRARQRKAVEIRRKENEIALREAYIRASIESQESERKRFARDLHDGMGQWISSLRLALSEVQNTETDDRKLEVLERSERILKDINAEFRSIAFNLMPHTLIHYGLAAALHEMIKRLNATGKCTFSVVVFGFPQRLPELIEIALYRVVQEWTTNIIKYSDATRTEIQLTGHEEELVVMIEDNGKGFDTTALTRGTGNGWKNIRSRVNLLNGTVDVDSSPERPGTTLTLTAPKQIGTRATQTARVVS